MANPLKDDEDILRVENFPHDLKKECRKVALDCEMTLKAFVIKWMRTGLQEERKSLANKTTKQREPALKTQR